MNKRIKVGIDYDDVMVDFLQRMVEVYNQKHSDNQISKESFETFDVMKCDKIKYPKSFYDIQNEYDNFYSDVKPNRNSQDVISEWIDCGIDVYIVTNGIMFPKQMESKYQSIKRLFPMINDKHIIYTADKSVIAVDVLIDDCADNLQKTIGRPILYSAYHNRNCFNYPRYNNWKELNNLFKGEM